MKNQDKCYVYLPVYNGSKFLRETMDSVLAQDYPDYQVVVCDDCSSDDSPEIIAGYAAQYPEKIIYERNRRNLGVGTTLHRCYMRYHDSRFFAQIGHDDVWPPDYLSQQIKKLKESDEAVAVFANNDYIDDRGKKLGRLSIFDLGRIDTLSRGDFFVSLVQSNFLCAPASVVDLSKLDPEVVTQYWGYNNERLQDCELWLNLSLRGKFLYNKSVTMHYRIHGNNLSDETKRVLQGKLELYTMLQRVLSSEAFFSFVDEQAEPTAFIDKLLLSIRNDFEYSNPLKILVINLCESLLNRGYESETIWVYLNWMYQDCGIITKCLKNGKHLTAPIVLLNRGVKNKDVLHDLGELPDFHILDAVTTLDPQAICATQEDGLEYLLSTQPYPYFFMHGQMVIFCQEDHVGSLRRQYPHLLVLSENDSARQVSRELYRFVEDKTHVFRNGIFDMIESPQDFGRGYHRVCVRTDEKIVRALLLHGHEVETLAFSTGQRELTTVPSETAGVLFQDGQVEGGELIITCTEGIQPKEQIIVNNELYVCVRVVMDSAGQLVPFFEKLCYCNNDIARGTLSYAELNALLVQKEIGLQGITGSFSYRVMLIFKKLINKLHLAGPIKWVGKKIYRLVKHKPFDG